MPTFKPNRSLLNAKFEGYKLDAIDQDSVLSRFPLEHPLTQSSAAGKSPLTFQEVQSRIRHNHLVVGPNGTAVYIDSELKVVRITWDNTESRPTFEIIYELPRILQSEDTDWPHREYPSAAFLDDSTLLVSDGNGALYVLQLGQPGNATLFNSYELNIPAQYNSATPSVPFRIHLARYSSENVCVVLLSSKHYAAPSEDSSAATTNKPKKSSSKYDIWAVGIDLSHFSQDQPLPLDIKWHRRGEDVPSYVAYVKSKGVFMLVGGSPYRPLSVPQPPKYEPTPNEIAPIPRANESLDSAPQPPSLPKPPPYSWTQTTDSVTVAFALPSDTPKNAIKVTFSASTLTLLVQGTPTSSSSNPIPLPRYALRKFWDGIHPSTSFWTFDRQAEHAYGLLTLHLDKQHEGTRWSHLFAQQPPSTSPSPSAQETAEEKEEDVPETLDPSELYAIRESLEKYTAALQTGDDASGLGLGRGVPSLAEGEMDDEVDLDTGDAVLVTWVTLDGSVPSWMPPSSAGSDSPFSMLATPLPSSSATMDSSELPSVVVKNGMDGLVYSLDLEEETGGLAWTHTATFCVLSFVLASKRDTRFVHHHPSKRAVLAFESGARGLGSNVYVYRATAHPGDKYAKQAVLKVGDASSGPLVGVGVLKAGEGEGEGETVTLCLCERELAMIRDTV